MKTNTKEAMDCSSRAATLAVQTDGTSDSERAEVVLERHRRSRLPSTHEGSAALSCAAIGFFFVFVFFLAMMFRIGVLETRVSPRRVIFAPLEPAIDSL